MTLTDLNQIWYGWPILSLYLKFSSAMTIKRLPPGESYSVFWYDLSDYTASGPRRQWSLFVSSALSWACRQFWWSCLVYYSDMKTEAIYYSETSGCLWTTWCYNPEDRMHSFVSVECDNWVRKSEIELLRFPIFVSFILIVFSEIQTGRKFYGLQGNIHLCWDVNQAIMDGSIWLITGIKHQLATRLPYQISAKYVEWFVKYMAKLINDPKQTRLY
jgi:hypothetical protein